MHLGFTFRVGDLSTNQYGRVDLSVDQIDTALPIEHQLEESKDAAEQIWQFIKSKVDKIWDTMWSGGISNPLSVIEQLTYLLFIKRLDELHTLKEAKAARTGKPIEDPIFAKGQDKLRWSRFKDAAPEQMFETVRDGVFPFIKTLGQGKGDEEDSTYTHNMKDALFKMPTAHVLANVVDQLDDIDMSDSDTKGCFEPKFLEPKWLRTCAFALLLPFFCFALLLLLLRLLLLLPLL